MAFGFGGSSCTTGNGIRRRWDAPAIAAFLSNLAVRRHVSSSTQNQALSAILFLYRHVLKREVGALEGLVWAKRAKRLPVVLTRDEVATVLDQLRGIEHLIATLL